MATIKELRQAGKLQARLCRENGSPTYAAIIEAITENGAAAETAIELLRADPRDAIGSAVYLRLLGAVNRLVLADETCALRQFYPSTGGRVDIVAAIPAFFNLVDLHANDFRTAMAADVQTNEIGRSVPLSAALKFIGGSLRLLEVGASAGLNLWPDLYHVCAGGISWGPPDSPVQLCGHFTKGAPPARKFEIVGRLGCDLNPVDSGSSAGRRLLRSFIWPEHIERLHQLDAALSIVPKLSVDRAEASDWVRHHLANLDSGVTTVVFHSMFWPYLSNSQRAEFIDVVTEAGERSDDTRPLAWVSLEPTDSYNTVNLICESWPRRQRFLLAQSNSHGKHVRWNPRLLSRTT